MLKVLYHIGPSRIHGMGVFTDQDIPAGGLVWQFDDERDLVITMEEFASLSPSRQQDVMHRAEWRAEKNAFVMGLDGDYFMNHSDAPTLIDLGDSMIAARFLPRGVELTCDYRDVQVLGLDMAAVSASNFLGLTSNVP